MDLSEMNHLESGLRGELRFNEPMARHVTWRAGGAAARAYLPADLDDLAAFLRATRIAEPLMFVGLGSNLLVRDGGVRGTVVLMHDALTEMEGAAGDRVERLLPGGSGEESQNAAGAVVPDVLQIVSELQHHAP